MADFQFYLNRQGVRGAKGVKGDKGDSPIVSVNKHTTNEYVLQIDNPDGTQIITPNLVGQQIVVNTAGDYVKYDRVSNQFVTAELPSATGEEEGLIRLATDADYTERDEFSAVTPYGLVQHLPSLITTSVDNLIRVFYDEPTDSIVLDTSKISEDISSINGSISNLTGKTNPATTTTAGIVKPDGRTITVTEDGTITAAGGSAPDNVVTTDTTQVITGSKTFSSSVVVGTNTNFGIVDTGSISLHEGEHKINISSGALYSTANRLRFTTDPTERTYGSFQFENLSTNTMLRGMVYNQNSTNYYIFHTGNLVGSDNITISNPTDTVAAKIDISQALLNRIAAAEADILKKQNKLVQGDNITLTDNGDGTTTISASGAISPTIELVDGGSASGT